MKRTSLYVAATLVMLAAAAYIYADIARPKPSPRAVQEGKSLLYTKLTILPVSNVSYSAKLQISESSLKELQTALATAQVSTPSLGQRISQSSTRTMIAGLFLFLSISFAGVWLTRSASRRNHKAIAAVLLGIAVLGAAAIITRANAGPPGYVRWAGLPKALTDGRATSAGVEIEVVPEGDGITLVIPIQKTKGNGEE